MSNNAAQCASCCRQSWTMARAVHQCAFVEQTSKICTWLWETKSPVCVQLHMLLVINTICIWLSSFLLDNIRRLNSRYYELPIQAKHFFHSQSGYNFYLARLKTFLRGIISIQYFLIDGVIALDLELKSCKPNIKFREKIQTWTGIRTPDFQISSIGLYQLSYPG